jgi:molybdopterin converting factor small subunit
MSETKTAVRVAVRYFAAARAAAGRAEQGFTLEPGATLESLLDRIERELPETDGRSRQVLARCSVLRNGESGASAATVLTDGDTVDLLPPFAGG